MIKHALIDRGNVQTRFDEKGVTISMYGSSGRPFLIPWDMLCHACAGLAAIVPPGSFYKEALEKVALDMQKIRSDFERTAAK